MGRARRDFGFVGGVEGEFSQSVRPIVMRASTLNAYQLEFGNGQIYLKNKEEE